MALNANYQAFLSRPDVKALAADASIHYIPTLTTITGPAAIVKHLAAQQKQVKKKHEKLLHTIEGCDSLCLETETSFQFLSGGGCLLPQLDDNFVADKLATLPLIHCVQFNPKGEIAQIRLFWDQASLLRNMDVIGARGRNWPIFDGKDQARLVASSVSGGASATTVRPNQGGRGANGDPHTSLSLFTPPETIREPVQPNAVAPRESAKPAPRDYHDLFAAGVQDESVLSASPTKENADPLKSGAGKNHQDNRLFDDHTSEAPTSPEPSIRTNPKKFDHFQIGEAEVPIAAPTKAANSKFTSSWDFTDVATPQKSAAGARNGNARQLAWEGDGVPTPGEPFHRPRVPQPRADQISQFKLAEATPRADKKSSAANSTTGAQSSARGLYHDPVFGTRLAEQAEKMPLGNMANSKGNRQNFDAHFDMTNAPSSKHGAADENGGIDVPDARKRGGNLEASWDFLQPSSPVAQQRGIKIAGNGQGTRTNTESNWWDYS